MYKILIVEDDLIIAKSVINHIRSWGFEAECVADFKDVLGTFVSYSPQLVLLDITLPFFNGYHWCSEIRRLSKVPIVFISSASDNMNIVMAINMGGDDFIAKPFDLNVLTAKVQALLRRTYDFAGQTNLLEHKGAILNTSDATINYNGLKLELSKNENKILQVLLENKGKTVSRDTIMTRLWETDSYIDDNTLTVNMTRLRKKLQEAGLADFITTKKGIGYMVE
jgi:DNA-binding response OmpR family regulator